ncbi:DEAD/DEAH box helicase [Jeotgalibacillus sp. R-1-5s-1]|uniref:DEAD/DEAH box helicase n=1 Tax=Jeotgalibacillus sp. R-1-5s-1 TaxID=2555897 RepID=UPI0010692D60|nr:DEAD/DEAH box helicase [Jeotgalibacillus sp. R-1-5s-1]TFE03245.1 DEAD/DEAH box helicase [Jeotgalibacillus sp. R-1-5s-1]
MRKKTLKEFISHFRDDDQFKSQVVKWHTIEPMEAVYEPLPEVLAPSLRKALERRGIGKLYSHQAEAFNSVMSGKSITAVTPTASGKTLCYNLPVVQSIVENPSNRALYLFPTKALSQDQKTELNELLDLADSNITSYTYDGDTPASIRQKVRKAGQIVITNPDMLHSAILPHHTKWVSLFENLKYIVIDELHIYRGVFGSHVANVIKRLKRICKFYGSDPIFICTSATIANPKELAESLTGKNMHLIDRNGAPSARKHFVFYNPPVVNQQLNIRRSATLEVRRLASLLLKEKIQTIVFAKSRVRVEIILSYLQELVKNELGPKSIRGYRGGYLPTQRREIEQGLRDGDVYGVVSTNALELGVDIGQLQACIMTGYPGTIASAWQQAGRAGRRQGEALILMVASSSPLDQYVVLHPEYFLKSSPETARINAENIVILLDHLKCAAFELPFEKGELFGETEIEDLLEYLAEERVLHFTKDKWYWMNDAFPAHDISLRSASQENVVIIDQSERANHRVIGEMDRFSAMTLLHDEAIYLHQGAQYQVEYLDWDEKKAYVREVEVDYFTDANLAVQLSVLEEDKRKETEEAAACYGDVSVRAMATLFKKIKFDTHENIGSGPISLPEEELHTSAAWFSLKEGIGHMTDEHVEQGLIGASHALKAIIPVHVMCDPQDIQVTPQVKAVHNQLPTLFIYDRYPGGIGLSEKVHENGQTVIRDALELIQSCVCTNGCPSCIGSGLPAGDAKKDTEKILEMFYYALGSEVN